MMQTVTPRLFNFVSLAIGQIRADNRGGNLTGNHSLLER